MELKQHLYLDGGTVCGVPEPHVYAFIETTCASCLRPYIGNPNAAQAYERIRWSVVGEKDTEASLWE